MFLVFRTTKVRVPPTIDHSGSYLFRQFFPLIKSTLHVCMYMQGRIQKSDWGGGKPEITQTDDFLRPPPSPHQII